MLCIHTYITKFVKQYNEKNGFFNWISKFTNALLIKITNVSVIAPLYGGLPEAPTFSFVSWLIHAHPINTEGQINHKCKKSRLVQQKCSSCDRHSWSAQKRPQNYACGSHFTTVRGKNNFLSHPNISRGTFAEWSSPSSWGDNFRYFLLRLARFWACIELFNLFRLKFIFDLISQFLCYILSCTTLWNYCCKQLYEAVKKTSLLLLCMLFISFALNRSQIYWARSDN